MTERDIFIAALQQEDPAQRRAYLDETCAGQPQLRQQVENLLRLHEGAGSFLEKPAAEEASSGEAPGAVPETRPGATVADDPGPERAGSYVGTYKLLQQIGEGGMGSVWMAEQSHPVQRKVALKLIKAGNDDRQVIARFEAERQALALMDHPNIAKVLDAGTTEAGRPYFVMELVKGVPITRYCDEHRLTPRQRLELMVPVCQAVQHAHQKGIIHRDLKPSNILIALYDGNPVPKVIDFGVAKATGQKLTDRTLFTGFGAVVGTLQYMSPEQAEPNQLDIDTRSDVYSLGVILYELLTGTTPLERKRFKEVALLEVLRLIREEEPPRPSTRLSDSGEALASISANRHMEQAKLTKLVRGELDWIVMKCLEKDRNRRYETANGFAMDVQRYLADEPVQACPPSSWYRLRKFATRNKRLLVAAAVVTITLLLGIVGTTWQAIRATNASTTATVEAERANREAGRASTEAQRATALAEQAKIEAAIAKAVNDFLNEDLLLQASPDNEPDREVRLRTLVERAATKIESRFRNQPVVEAAIRQVLGDIHGSLGDSHKAEEQYRLALDLRRQHLGPHDTATLSSMTCLAAAFNAQKRHVEAEKLHRETLEIKKRVLGPEHPSILENMTGLANSSLGQGRPADAEKLHREVYEARRRVLGPEHPHTLLSRDSLALAIKRQGRNAEAEKILREVLEIRSRVLRAEHPDILTSKTFLAGAVRDQDRLAEAEQLYREVYDTRKRVLGPEHPATLRSRNFLAAVLKRQGRHADAKPLWDEGMTHSRKGREHSKAGRREEAADSFRQAIATLEGLADEFPVTLGYHQQLGNCYLWLFDATDDSQEKELLLQKARTLWGRLAADFPKDEWNWSNLGFVHSLLGEWHKAADAQTRVIALNDRFSEAWHRRGSARANLGEWKDAVADQTRALELDPKNWWAWCLRGEAYGVLKQWDKALADCEQAIELGATAPKVWVCKAAVLAQLEQPDQAIAELRQAIAKGFRDAKGLRNNKDLAALRERADFKKLLTELEAKNK